MEKLRVALIGCGSISNNHIIPLSENDKVTLVALCDIVREKAEAKLIEHSLSLPIYTDYVEMLDKENLDAVHIATPHFLHAEMTIEALKRNINVFLEKPMCISQRECEIMLAAEKASKGRVCVCFQNRFNHSTLFAKRLIAEDGGATSGYGALFWNRGERYYARDAWRGKKATEGGGVMINQAIHTIDLLYDLFGTPKQVCATVSNHSLKGVIDVEDSAEGVIYFDEGRQANFYATNSFRGISNNYVYVTTKNHKIEIRLNHLYLDGERIDDDEGNIPVMGKEVYGTSHMKLIDLFYSAILSGDPMPIPMESAQYPVRIICAAYNSFDTPTDV